jgi:hypothetical protein
MQACDVPLSGEFERSGQQMLFGREPVRSRRQRQSGGLGYALMCDGVRTDVGGNSQHGFEEHFASRRTAWTKPRALAGCRFAARRRDELV